ncbi:MAG: hypothetical protein M3237_03815 [Actinomycetota bacterium]|nr:hypothetical protein [Actinomycetota bacterium]
MLRRVGELREQGADIRALADQLVARTEALGWSGRAAESMRHRIRDRATHLRAAAAQHDTAADSLERHAHEVARVQEAIADSERKVTALVADARTRIARIEAGNESRADSGVHTLPDADDRSLAGFDPPPSGHKDWLTVDLPGLRTT